MMPLQIFFYFFRKKEEVALLKTNTAKRRIESVASIHAFGKSKRPFSDVTNTSHGKEVDVDVLFNYFFSFKGQHCYTITLYPIKCISICGDK